MNIFIIILLILAGIIVLLLITALFMRRNHYVQCDIIINVPQQEAFDFLKLLSNQDKFNKWAATDPGRTETFKGTDGTVGYIYAWSGNKSAGKGEKEIMSIVDGKSIETEIRFEKPMRVSSRVVMQTEAVSDTQTKVTLSNGGILSYPLNVLIPVFEKNFAGDLYSSLVTLKGILEK